MQFTLEQSLKALKGIDVYLYSFFHLGTIRRWVVNVTPRPPYSLETDPVPIVQEAGWALGPVWTGAENLVSFPKGFDPHTVQP